MMNSRNVRKQSGFTLTELLMTGSVASVLLTLVAPAFTNLILTQDVRTGASDLQTSLVFARSEAIKRATSVSMVPSGGNWKNGWTVQLGDGTVLRKELPLSSQLASMTGATITYQADGHIAPPVPGTIKVYVSSNSQITPHCLAIDLSGRPSLLVSDGNSAHGCS